MEWFRKIWIYHFSNRIHTEKLKLDFLYWQWVNRYRKLWILEHSIKKRTFYEFYFSACLMVLWIWIYIHIYRIIIIDTHIYNRTSRSPISRKTPKIRSWRLPTYRKFRLWRILFRHKNVEIHSYKFQVRQKINKSAEVTHIFLFKL